MSNEIKRQECQIYSRVCGWLVPRHAMNPGKIAEVNDRVWFSNEIATKDL